MDSCNACLWHLFYFTGGFMAQYDGSIRINTKINTEGIKKGVSEMKGGFGQLKSGVQGALSGLNSKISSVGSKFRSVGAGMRKEASKIKGSVNGVSDSFRNLGATIASVFAVRKIAGFASSMTELGSDLEEVQNVVDVTFTTMSDKINEFAVNAEKSAGLSETMAKRYAGTFGAMAKSFGFAEDAAFGMSTTLTQLAGDVASFYNISQDEAYTKLKSVFTGETETLKDLGVVMTENALNSYAMAKGIGKTVSKMTDLEKVALRYQFVTEKLSGASGDFIRTQDSWANQTRILKLQIESLKATIGQGLINVLNPLLKMLNTLLEKLKVVANAFKSFTESFFGKNSSGGSGAGNKYVDTAEGITGSLEDVSDAAQEAEKSLEGYLSPLDEINKYSTGKDDELLSDLENIDFGNLGDLDMEVNVNPNIDESGLSDKFRQMAEKIKEILTSLFNPLKEAWDREGKFVIDSWKYALGEVWKLIKDIGRDFLTVWQQEGTIRIFENILHIIGDIGLVVGNLAGKFREAWNENDTGLHILENIRDIIGAIVENIRHAADATVEWSAKIDFSPLLTKFEEWTASLVPVIDTLSGIITDFYEKVLLPLGQWVLEKGLPDLLQVFIDFNEMVDWESLRANFSELWEHLEPFAETVGEGLIIFIGRLSEVLAGFLNSQALKDFLTMIENWMDNVSPQEVADGFEKIAIAIIALKGAGAALTFISSNFDIISAAANMLKGAFSLLTPVISGLGGVFSALISPVGLVVAAVSALAAGFIYAYNTSEEFRNKVSELKEKFIEFWEASLKPMLEEWGQKFKELWEEHLKPCIEKLMEMLKTLWEDVLLPLAGWIVDTILPVILPIINEVFNTTIDLIGWIIDVIDGLFDVIKDTVGLVADLLRGDWSGAWEHAENIVSTVFDGITGTIERAVGWIRDQIDKIIDKFRSMKEKVGDFFSGDGSGDSGQNYSTRSYSMRSIQSPYASNPAYAALSSTPIPRLATGAVIPANKEFLAVLGDQKHGTNVEAPLDTIRQASEEAVLNVLSRLGFNSSIGNSNPQTIIIKQYLDGKQVAEAVVREGELQQMSSGNNMFLLGTT